MAKQANMVPINVIAVGICDNFGDSTRKYFGEHLKNIISAYHFLHLFLTQDVAVKTITLSPDNIVDLPCNFVRETKIGIINEFGRIATMSVDKNLRLPSTTLTTQGQVDCALTDIECGTAPDDFYSFYNAYDRDSNYVGELRGYSCSLNSLGYFNIDRENGVLICSPHIPKDQNIIMEYISDGISDGLALVPIELVSCITNKAKAMFCLDKKDNRAPTFEELYQQAYRNAKRLYLAQRINVYANLFKTLT